MTTKKKQPTQRSLEYLRDKCGAMAGVVEKWNMHAKPRPVRVDLFGFIDIIAVVPARKGAVGIQATAASGITHRIHKVMDTFVDGEINDLRNRAIRWCEAGNRLLFHGWRKNSKNRWVLDERELVQTSVGWEVVTTQPSNQEAGPHDNEEGNETRSTRRAVGTQDIGREEVDESAPPF